MTRTLEEVMAGLSPERRKRVEESAARELAEYKALKKSRDESGNDEKTAQEKD